MPKQNLELISKAISAAEQSLRLAKQLLGDLEKGSGASSMPSKDKVIDDTPGILGIFDGEGMNTTDGKNFPVPANYASKSMLVVGDTLKLIEEGKEKRFKQVEHVKRQKTIGVLAKKDGKWKVVTPEGSYKVLPASVSHFGVDVGSEVVLQIPSGNLTVAWGAIEAVKSSPVKEDFGGEEVVAAPSKPEEKKVEKSVPAPVIAETPKKEEVKKIVPKVETKEVAKPVPVVIEKPKEPEVVKPTPVVPEKPKAPQSPAVEATPAVQSVPAKVEAPASEMPVNSGEDELT